MSKAFPSNSSGPGQVTHLNPKTEGPVWIRWVPGLNTFRRYERSWLRHDLVAGLVMTAMLVPVGIAYAQASGLPGITGLYATIVPLLAYAVFGPSPILILGPDSALAAVILSVVAPLSAGDSQRAVRIAGLMAIVSGRFGEQTFFATLEEAVSGYCAAHGIEFDWEKHTR